jgi:signal transduction histidine kinase
MMLIRTRIRLLVIVLLTVSIGGGIAALRVIDDLQLAILESQRSRTDLVAIGEIRDLLLITTGEIADLPKWQAPQRDLFSERIGRCQQIITDLQRPDMEISTQERQAIEALARPVKNFSRAVSNSLRYVEEGLEDRALERTRNWLRDHLLPDIGEAVRSLQQIQQERVGQMESRARSASELVTTSLRIMGIIMLALCGGFFLLLKRWIITPIERLSHAAQLISQGHYGEPIPVSSGDELGSLAREVESMSNDIAQYQERLVDRERLAAVGEMTASVAHNLRNPLGSIRALAQGCLRSDDDDLVEPSLRTIMETVDRADRWLRDLLQGLKPIRLDRKPISDLGDHLSRICDAVQSFGQRRQVEIAIEIKSELPALEIDLRRLEQTIIVLLNNAIEASSAGSIVSLVASTSDRDLIIEVRDEGTGMTEEVQSRLFSPYFTTKKGGLGLGLSLTQRIIHGHGGRIDVVSSLGAGSTLTVAIPLERDTSTDKDEKEADGADTDPR